MNWYSQLTQLVWGYYREDIPQLQQLHALKNCKLSRRWGVLRVNCPDQQTADAMVRASEILCEPIAQLRLAQQVNILVRGTLMVALAVDEPKLIR